MGSTGDSLELMRSPSISESLTPTRIPLINRLFWDPRSEARPSKFARAFLGSPGATSAIAKDSDGSRCVVAGRESLKVIRIRDTPDLQPERLAQTQAPRRAIRVLATGPGGAQLVEELNLWGHSRLPPTSSLMTDVVWGSGPSSNKIATSCSNGDIILWDINKGGSKLEKVWREEHQRAVNCILFGPTLPHLLLTGSQDTIVKIWDIRVPNGARLSLPHSTAVRALAMSPNPLSASVQHQCLVALEGGDIVRWDIRAVAPAPGASSGKGSLDKMPVAHQGAILGMDWSVSDGKGWLCTGGQDKTVRVWDISHPTLSSTPVHTLHAPHPIKKVKWRPNNPTEIAVVPRTVGISPLGIIPSDPNLPGKEAANIAARFAPGTRADYVEDPDRVEVWDVRRQHISKYVLLGSEGACAAVLWTDSDSLCAVYQNGAFTRHDVQHSYTPIDRVPRHSMAWDAMGGMSFITGKRDIGEIPFDDVVPALAFPQKNPAEVRFESSQVAAYVAGPIATSFDKHTFRTMARSYKLEGDSQIAICKHNSTIATEVGDWNAVQVWDKLRGLLAETLSLTPLASRCHSMSRSPSRSSVASSVLFVDDADGGSGFLFPLRSHIKSHSPSEQALGRTSRDPSQKRHRRRVSSLSKGSARSLAAQSLSRSVSRDVPESADQRKTSTPPSTALHPTNGLSTIGTVSVVYSNQKKSPSLNSPHSQHSSTRKSPVSPVTSTSRSSTMSLSGRGRRKPISDGRGPELGRATSGTRSRSHSLGSAAALLALGDDDTGSGERSDDEDDDLDDSDVSLDGPSSRNPAPRPLTSLPEINGDDASVFNILELAPSPRSVVAVPPSQKAHPSSGIGSNASDTGALGDDNYDSSSSIDGPRHSSSKAQDKKGASTSGPNHHGGKIMLPVRAIDHYLDNRTADEERLGIPKVFSELSVRTAVPSKQSHIHSSFVFPQKQDEASENLFITGTKSRERLSSIKFQSSMTIKAHGSGNDRDNRVYLPKHGRGRSRSSRRGNKVSGVEIEAAHQRIWELGWESLRQRIEEEIASGNIQLAATVCIVAGGKIFDNKQIEDLCATYVEVLTRLRLFSSAARVRKFSKLEGICMASMLDTDIHMACAKCRKAFLVPVHIARNRENSGLFQYCKNCRKDKARCSICHLPVKGLLFFCQSCSHGGHQECYRGYILARPLIRDPRQNPLPFDVRGRSARGGAIRTSFGSQQPIAAESSSLGSTEPDAQFEADESALALQKISFMSHNKAQLRFHACPTGCGHFCWGTNDASD
ncbi:uncharacterized protein EI90DRAFT_3288120 [Cantharellus anzutake]|uniref:uncharacterized protein n=1 Tax=Cantharellus anzutake TaxID=1750568 RepID=UPI001905B640|nr:uncharacterized protein EI90DRAFT_3288120 [Cantharellus anzutake]KAF8334603.1 hypothetical protein EI90DRAFT_3288120 [Cantharellus anzutake]